jgi:hypothetical protein
MEERGVERAHAWRWTLRRSTHRSGRATGASPYAARQLGQLGLEVSFKWFQQNMQIW